MSRKPILGIDIGHDQLKLALVNNGTVLQTGSAQMPENLFHDGRFRSLDVMASLIRDTMKENGIKATRAAVILPDESVYVKNVEMPLMTEEQLGYNLPFEFHDYISGEVQDFLFDYAVIDGEDEEPNEPAGALTEMAEENMEIKEVIQLMAVGIEKGIVEDIEQMLRKAGLKLVKSAPTLSAFISLIREKGGSLQQGSDECGILDLGYHAINLYMYRKDRHIATRGFEIGLSSLDDIVADRFGVEKHLAHTYVMNNYEDCLNSEECAGFYDNIAVELMRAINFYEFSNQGSSLTDIWVCGGGAANLPLIRTIGETLEADLHPSYKLLPGESSIPQHNSFVQAIGVTLEI